MLLLGVDSAAVCFVAKCTFAAVVDVVVDERLPPPREPPAASSLSINKPLVLVASACRFFFGVVLGSRVVPTPPVPPYCRFTFLEGMVCADPAADGETKVFFALEEEEENEEEDA